MINATSYILVSSITKLHQSRVLVSHNNCMTRGLNKFILEKPHHRQIVTSLDHSGWHQTNLDFCVIQAWVGNVAWSMKSKRRSDTSKTPPTYRNLEVNVKYYDSYRMRRSLCCEGPTLLCSLQFFVQLSVCSFVFCLYSFCWFKMIRCIAILPCSASFWKLRPENASWEYRSSPESVILCGVRSRISMPRWNLLWLDTIRYQLGSPTFEESGFYKCFFCLFWAFFFHLGSTNPVFQEPTKALEQQTLHVNVKLVFQTDLFKSVDYMYWRLKYQRNSRFN